MPSQPPSIPLEKRSKLRKKTLPVGEINDVESILPIAEFKSNGEKKEQLPIVHALIETVIAKSEKTGEYMINLTDFFDFWANETGDPYIRSTSV